MIRALVRSTIAAVVLAYGMAVIAYWVMYHVASLRFRTADRAGFYVLCAALPVLWAVLFFRMRLRRAPAATAFGSAQWMPRKAVRRMTEGGGLVIGREDRNGGRFLRYGGPAHLITLAPTRTGKGVGTIIPNLLTATRSVMVIDPKGENAAVTWRTRSRFGPVHVLDPFGVTGLPPASCNPLDRIDPFAIDAAEDAALLADALIADPPHQVAEAHWNEEAKALLAGLILFVAAEEASERRGLATVRELLTLPVDRFERLLDCMQDSLAAGGLVARAANRHLAKSDREASGVLSSAQRHTHFLDSPRMTAVMRRSDFAFAALKEQTATVFLVLPPDRISSYSRWLRLMVAQAMTELARSSAQPPAPVLFLLDEFAALGRLEPVERAMGLMAGYGVQLWPILQDLHQLRGTYGTRAGTFLSNAGLVQVFNVNDTDTAEWVSRALGDTTEMYETGSRGETRQRNRLGAGSSSTGTAVHLVRRALLTPDEVRRLPPDSQILFAAGAPPIFARKLRYYADPEFRGLFDASGKSAALAVG
jgi:type IV secretion system protein VirD4